MFKGNKEPVLPTFVPKNTRSKNRNKKYYKGYVYEGNSLSAMSSELTSGKKLIFYLVFLLIFGTLLVSTIRHGKEQQLNAIELDVDDELIVSVPQKEKTLDTVVDDLDGDGFEDSLREIMGKSNKLL